MKRFSGLRSRWAIPFSWAAAKPLRNGNRDIEGLAKAHRAVAKAFAEGLALKQLGNDVGRAVLLADGKDGENVGMVQGGGGFGLQLKAPQAIGIARERSGQNLDGHIALE